MARNWLIPALLMAASCGSPAYDIQHIGPGGPPQPPGCPLEVIPGPPPYPVQDIAIIKVRCGMSGCSQRLMDRACELGANVLHTNHDIRSGAYRVGTAAIRADQPLIGAPQETTGGEQPPGGPPGY